MREHFLIYGGAWRLHFIASLSSYPMFSIEFKWYFPYSSATNNWHAHLELCCYYGLSLSLFYEDKRTALRTLDYLVNGPEKD